MTRAAIYARKSTQQRGADEESKSVARQIENARAFAAARGWTVEHVYADDAIGGAEVRRLKDKQRLLETIRRGAPFEVLVMRDESRFSRRDGDEAFAELKAITRAGVAVWFYGSQARFTFGSFGENVVGFVKAEAAADYRRQISLWVTEAMAKKAAAGYVTGGRCFGYDNLRVGGHVERRINEGEAAVVRRIFELVLVGLGKASIAKQLNAEHAPAPRAQQGRPNGWAGSSVREVLYREAYRGRAVWNRTKKRDASGEISAHVITRAEHEWIRRDRPELRIVDEALWQAAHARLEERQAIYLHGTRGQSWGRPVNGIASRYLLTGLAQCGRCGGPLEVRSRSHGRTRAYFYQCSTHRRRGAAICRGIAVPLESADDAILSLLESRVLDPEVLRLAAARVLAQLAAWDPEATRVELVTRRRALDVAVTRLVDRLADGESPAIATGILMREQERDAIDRELEALASRCAPPSAAVVHRTLEALVEDWRGAVRRDVAAGRQMVKTLLRGRIVFEPEARDEQPGYRLRARGSVEPVLAIALNLDRAHAVVSPTGFEPVFWP